MFSSVILHLLFNFNFILCMGGVMPAGMYVDQVHVWYPRRLEEASNPLRLEIKMVVRHHVTAVSCPRSPDITTDQSLQP